MCSDSFQEDWRLEKDLDEEMKQNDWHFTVCWVFFSGRRRKMKLREKRRKKTRKTTEEKQQFSLLGFLWCGNLESHGRMMMMKTRKKRRKRIEE